MKDNYMPINSDQMLILLRTILKIGGTLIVAHGTLGLNGAAWEQLSGGILMIAPVIWDMFVHTDSAKIKSVTAMPDVAQIVVKSGAVDGAAAAAADPAQPKVVSA